MCRGLVLLPLILVTLGVCLSGCARTSESGTWVKYERSGGIAGLDDHLRISANGEAVLDSRSQRHEFSLSPDTVNRLESLFEAAKFSGLEEEYLPSSQGADRLEYVVTYEGHTVRTADGAVPSSLQAVLDALNQIVQNR